MGHDAVIGVSINENITSGVVVNIDDEDYPVVLVGGKGNVSVSNLTAGLYNVTVTFAGSDEFMDSQKRGAVVVYRNDNVLIVDVGSEY